MRLHGLVLLLLLFVLVDSKGSRSGSRGKSSSRGLFSSLGRLFKSSKSSSSGGSSSWFSKGSSSSSSSSSSGSYWPRSGRYRTSSGGGSWSSGSSSSSGAYFISSPSVSSSHWLTSGSYTPSRGSSWSSGSYSRTYGGSSPSPCANLTGQEYIDCVQDENSLWKSVVIIILIFLIIWITACICKRAKDEDTENNYKCTAQEPDAEGNLEETALTD